MATLAPWLSLTKNVTVRGVVDGLNESLRKVTLRIACWYTAGVAGPLYVTSVEPLPESVSGAVDEPARASPDWLVPPR